MLIPVFVESVEGKVVADIRSAFRMSEQHDMIEVLPLPVLYETFAITRICERAIEFFPAVLVESDVFLGIRNGFLVVDFKPRVVWFECSTTEITVELERFGLHFFALSFLGFRSGLGLRNSTSTVSPGRCQLSSTEMRHWRFLLAAQACATAEISSRLLLIYGWNTTKIAPFL